MLKSLVPLLNMGPRRYQHRPSGPSDPGHKVFDQGFNLVANALRNFSSFGLITIWQYPCSPFSA